jgi:hypothetical protein
MSSRSQVRVLVVCFLLVSRLPFADSFAQQPAPPVSQSIDEETRQQVRDLKLKALQLQRSGDLKKELEIWNKVLSLDPDDARAQVRSDELSKTIAANEKEDVDRLLKAADDEARKKLADEALKVGEDAVVDAKLTRSADALKRAEAALDRARKNTREGDERVARLEAAIAQERQAQRVRLWQFWGLVGLVVLGVLVVLVLYLRRGKRVLELLDGSQMGDTFVLQNKATVIGALAAEVDWVIDDPYRKISRRHCDIIREGRHYFVVDCSMNGTFLNGRPLQKGEPALLKRGDRIGLGGAVTLRFR